MLGLVCFGNLGPSLESLIWTCAVLGLILSSSLSCFKLCCARWNNFYFSSCRAFESFWKGIYTGCEQSDLNQQCQVWFIEAQFEWVQEQLFITLWRKQRHTAQRNAPVPCTLHSSPRCCPSWSQEMAEYQGLIKCNLSWESKVAASSSPLCEHCAVAAWHQIIQSGLHAELLVFVIKISSQWLRGLFSGSAPESLFIWASGGCGYLTPNQCCIRQPFYGYTSRRIFSKGMMFSPSDSIQMESQP